MAASINLKFDVLIVGSGAAGMAAALSSSEAGAKTAIISKGTLGKSSATYMSGGGFTFEDQFLSKEDHLKKIEKTGYFLSDSRLARAMAQYSKERILGFFSKNRLSLIHAGSPRRPGYYRVPKQAEAWGGARLSLEMARCIRRSEIASVEKVFGEELLLDDHGCCAGAEAIAQNGDHYIIEAKATIICAGGCASIFARHGTPSPLVGDGFALAYELGAELRDMEFHQFYPLGIFEEGFPSQALFPPYPDKALIINERGEDLIEKYLGPGVSVYKAAVLHRDDLSCALEKEYQVGGSAMLFLEEASMGKEIDAGAGCIAQLTALGFPMKERPLKVKPLSHTTLGGIAINEKGATSVENLYAAGESAGGVHGANRAGGAALAECIFFGLEAGQNAAQKALAHGTQKGIRPRDNWSEKLKKKTGSSSGCGEIISLSNAIRAISQGKCGILRDKKGLSMGLSAIAEVREKLSRIKVADFYEYRKLRETENMALCCEMSIRSALLRDESRGCHRREDRPEISHAMGSKRTGVKKLDSQISAYLADLS